MPLTTLLCCLCLWLALFGRANAQPYYELWQAGRYKSALDSLEQTLDQESSVSSALLRDYAELLFVNGHVDTAIEVMEPLFTYYPLPSHAVQLARLYQYRGRRHDMQQLLDEMGLRALELLESRRLNRVESLALGQLMELRGEDPQTILRYYARLNEQYPDYAAVYVAAGDLAAQHYAYDVAARQYGRALALEAHQQQALAGLAAAYHQSNDPRLHDALDTLLARNPNHPRALVLRAEQALDIPRPQQALACLDTILATNPTHLEALSLKAAAYFLQDRLDEAHQIRQQGLEFNPFAAMVWRASGRIASRHYRFADGRDFQRRALEIDPQDQQARLLLAFDLLRLGLDAEARTALEQVATADPYNVQAYNLLNAADAIDQFHTLNTDLFTVQMPAAEAAILADDALALLTGAARQYQHQYQIDLQPPILVQFFADHDQFMVRSVGLPGNVGHLGICFGRVVTMDSPRARPPGQMNWHQVLWHEFVHVITLEKTGNRIPRWLSEGISVYEETRHDSTWGQGLDTDFLAFADPLNPPGLDHLEACFTQPTSADQLLYGYLAAGEFVRFYTAAHGHTALVAALDSIAVGYNAVPALVAAAHTRTTVLDQHFRVHMRTRLAPLLNLEDAFKAAMQQASEAAAAGHIDAAAQAYLQAHSLYPDNRSADAPLYRLAALYKAHNRHQAYRETLERIIWWDPKAYEACLELARLAGAQQRWLAVDRYLARAAQIVPFNLDLLMARVVSAQSSDNLAAAATQLQKLLFLDPARATDHRLHLAQTLARLGDTHRARAQVLTLLEQNPGFWEAQQLLLELAQKNR